MFRLAGPIRPLVLFALVAAAAAQTASPPARSSGLKVTYAALDPDRRAKEGEHSQRVRLLAMAVERGETPSPMLEPGMFSATFRGFLPLPVRDRFRIRVEGKGSFELAINGERVLASTLRPGKPEETTQPVRLVKGDNEFVLRLESNATGEAQLRVLWSGTDFAFEPISPERWQWPTNDDDIAKGEQLRRGQQLFVDRRCIRCHVPEPPVAGSFGELDHKAPDLRNVASRLQPEFLAEWLRNPRAVRPDASMPRPQLESATEVDDLTAWLATLGQPLAEPGFAAEAATRGAVRFLELGCIACHVPPEQAVVAVDLRGRMPLHHVPRKWRPVALVQYLREPARDQAHTAMPDFRLDGDDATALAAYLTKDAPAPTEWRRGDVDAGRRLAQRHGCDRCHDAPVPETGRRYQEPRALHADHGCLADAPPPAAPDHGLDAADRAALRAFLPEAEKATSRRAPIDYAARMVQALRCTHCHGLDGAASVWAQVAQSMSTKEPLPVEQDPAAQGVPALSHVGGKLQPSWMERFVRGELPSPRPWLHARMPSFAAHGTAVVAGLVRSHGYGSGDEPPVPPDAQLVVHGARLVKIGEGFACVQCHGVGATPPVQVFERQGVNFAVAASRLRHEYFMRWLLDPQRVDPSAKMPKLADSKGRTPIEGVLDGDARKQFEAIWQWFGTLK